MKMVAPLEVGICCKDLTRLGAFYTQVLGFKQISLIEVPAAKASQTGLSEGGYQVMRLQSPWGERIKLLQPALSAAPRVPVQAILSRCGTTYLTFIVERLQFLLENLSAQNVELLSGPRIIEVRSGVFLVFARDPEGNILEFVEYADLAAYRPDLVQGGAHGP